jgi:serine/threonine protein kinase
MAMTTREGEMQSVTASLDGNASGHRSASCDGWTERDDSAAVPVRSAAVAELVGLPRSSVAEGTALAHGRLRILRRIGQGGTGVVYEAFDAQREERVALKLLRGTESRQIYRLKNEFRALAGVTHQNVVQLHELFRDEQGWFFTMDLLRGVPFDQWVRPCGELHEARLRSALAQLASAVDAIHRAGRLHRDLKPSNVLVCDGHVVVLDFGLAAEPQVGGVGQTITDDFVSGTPAYMAPEQAALAETTSAADLYAIGVMLFEALTGQLPFEGSARAVLVQKMQKDAPRASGLRPEVPEALDLLCARLLARAPEARPSLAELLELGTGAPAGSRTSEPPSRPPELLLGREPELCALRAELEDTLAGRAIVMLVSGESGMGKSALVGGFLDELRKSAGAVVLAGRCYERESVPFKGLDSLVDDLSRHLRRLPQSAAAALLPRDVYALARLFPVLDRVEAVANAPTKHIADPLELRRRAFAAFGELIARIRDRSPLCLHIDDVQWLDTDSVLFLRALLVTPDLPPTLLVLSHRSEGAQDNHALQQVLGAAEMNSCVRLRRLAVGPLSQPASAELAARLLPEAAQGAPEVASAIARESSGSPYLVGELARYVTRHRDAPSALHGISVAAALNDHRSALPEAACRVLELCALTGRPLPSALVVRAAEAGHAEIDLLCQARLARLVDLEGDRTVECYHDRVRETVAAGIAPLQRVAYSRRLAHVLEGHPGIDPELLARCFEGGGDRKQAAHYSARAAEQAMAGLAFDYAADLYRKALALGAPGAEERTALRIALADALTHAGRDKQAADIYLDVAASVDPGLRAQLRRRSAQLLLTTGHEAGAQLLGELYREVGMSLPSSPGAALRRRIGTQLALRLRGLRYRRREERELPDILRERLETATLVFALASTAPLMAAAASDDYLLLALSAGEPRHLGRAAINQAYFLSFADPTQARVERLLDLGRSLTAELNDTYSCGRLQMEIACVEINRAQWAAGAAAAERAIALLSSQARGASYEVDSARFKRQVGEFQLGKYAWIVQTTPTMIEEDFSRERIWAAVLMTGPFGSPAWLCRDDAAGYQRALTAARVRWKRQADAPWPDFLLLLGQVGLHLYCREPERAQALFDREWDALDFTLRHAVIAASQGLLMRGMTALAMLRVARDRAQARRYRQVVAGCCRRLARMRLRHAHAYQRVLAAGVAAHAARHEAARVELRAAVNIFDELGMAVYAAAARRRLSALLGGSEGATMLAQADAAFRERAVVNLEGMTELHCAGFPTPQT